MSDSTFPSAPPPSYPSTPGPAVVRAPERVGLGLLASLGAVVLGVVAAVILWKAGFIASLSSFVIAGGGVLLYTKAAGAPPRRGIAPLMLIILLGIAASFFAVVASDLSDVYSAYASAGAVSRVTFIRENLTNPDVLGSYGKDLGMFVLFAALGVFSTMRRLVRSA